MAADKNFMWTDKVNALLHVVFHYKVGKAGEGVDWETVRRKYEDITKMFLEKYPDNDSVRFHRSRVNARWNRASICPCKNLSGFV